MAQKKNGKSKVNQTTTLEKKNDAHVSVAIKLTGKAATSEVPDS